MRVSNINLATIAYYACFDCDKSVTLFLLHGNLSSSSFAPIFDVIHLCGMKKGGRLRRKCCSASVQHFTQCDSFLFFRGTLFKTHNLQNRLLFYSSSLLVLLSQLTHFLWSKKLLLLSFDTGPTLKSLCLLHVFILSSSAVPLIWVKETAALSHLTTRWMHPTAQNTPNQI